MAGDTSTFDGRQPYRIHRVKSWPVKGGSSLAIAIRMLRLCVGGGFDVVLCGFASPLAILANVVGRVTRVPYAVYTHGEDVVAVRMKVKRSLLAASLKRACVVMCNSRFSAAEVARFGVPASRIRTFSPGIEATSYLDAPAAEVDALRQRFAVEGKKVLLTLARLEARKGHDVVVRALPDIATAVPNVHYLVVGRGDPTPLLSLATELGVRERVTIVDYVPDGSLPALFTLCDVYVMPSRLDSQTRQVEGFGIVYLEAAACGKPTVAGNQGGAPDAVVDGVTGLLVDPTNPAQIAHALTRLLVDEEEARRMGRAGRERVRRDFDKRHQLRLIEQTLACCAGREATNETEG
jgi:phosphatidylinositol alpha-1,6-mannosyltransferase